MRIHFLTLSVISSFCLSFNPCKAKEYITSPDRSDGFGGQFQTAIYSAIYAELTGAEFLYTPFKNMEHNYDNDPEFISKKEALINFIGNFEINTGNARRPDVWEVIRFFEKNIGQCAKSKSLQKIKKLFRANKDRSHYFDSERFHIVIHIRRHNAHDSRIEGTNTDDMIYLNAINKLRSIYASKKPLFHVQSQGDTPMFSKFNAEDIILHLNESNEDSFISMVLADALVISKSSFSYTAGILSDAQVYYIPFWHVPLPGWIAINTLT